MEFDGDLCFVADILGLINHLIAYLIREKRMGRLIYKTWVMRWNSMEIFLFFVGEYIWLDQSF